MCDCQYVLIEKCNTHTEIETKVAMSIPKQHDVLNQDIRRLKDD